RKPIALVLMDLRLPDASGMDLAKELRQTSHAGLIFVTSVNDEIDRVLGLELGADDYVTKPIALRELLARIRSTLRRVAPAGEASRSATMRFLGPWEIDLFRREARDAAGAVAQLTRAEFDLLAALVEADGRSVARDLLLDVVSNRSEEVSDRTVDTLISRLRAKLEADPKQPGLVLTDRGVGYRAAVGRR
ncbi:MAG: winged helix-turn-helix domain-containing protein, partial [Elsteraceae bacterium]